VSLPPLSENRSDLFLGNSQIQLATHLRQRRVGQLLNRHHLDYQPLDLGASVALYLLSDAFFGTQRAVRILAVVTGNTRRP